MKKSAKPQTSHSIKRKNNEDNTIPDLCTLSDLHFGQRLLQFAIECTPDAVYLMEPSARFVYVNNAACNALGYSRVELLGMTVHNIDPNLPRQVWINHWQDLKNRGSFIIESAHRTKSGTVFPVEIRINYLAFEGKEYNIAFARDITSRKKSAQDRERLLKKLEKTLNKVKTLSGLLPICAKCKRIRDKHGKWHQIEVYVHNHSKADFSHGLCPQCAKQLYK
ncbi:MAG: PAS domain S-box protein [Spirochaetales bacterium]|nr:PAS domain S-box protein [Spirochaetales bacterium]